MFFSTSFILVELRILKQNHMKAKIPRMVPVLCVISFIKSPLSSGSYSQYIIEATMGLRKRITSNRALFTIGFI